jgi:opacity protein-like surface antigen
MKKWMVLAVLVVAVMIVVSPANAQGNKYKVYAAANYLYPTSDLKTRFDDEVDTVEASDSVGWSLGFEWRLGKWGGLEFDYLRAESDIEFAGETIAETTMSPLTASFNFHIIHTKIIDFYVGPSIAYVTWDDITDIDGESSGVDSGWAYGAQIGTDFSLVKAVALVTAIRWQQMDLSPSDGDESIGVNPLYAKVGIAVRW